MFLRPSSSHPLTHAGSLLGFPPSYATLSSPNHGISSVTETCFYFPQTLLCPLSTVTQSMPPSFPVRRRSPSCGFFCFHPCPLLFSSQQSSGAESSKTWTWCGVGTPACWASPARGCRALLHSFSPGHRLFPSPSVSRILFSPLHLRTFAHIGLHACNSLPIYLVNSYPTFRAQRECYIKIYKDYVVYWAVIS